MKRKVCVVVASRANYGRVKSCMQAARDHPDLELQLIVGASALLYKYGSAIDVIRRDGFEPQGVVEQNLLDHAVSGFSPKQHPLVFVRDVLTERGYLDSQQLKSVRDGQFIAVAGLVITRQRPMTAKGTFFITLEDEVGFVNVIVYKAVFERHHRLLSRGKFMGIRGKLQQEEGVCSLLGVSFVDLAREKLLSSKMPKFEKWGGLPSRDFH